MPNAFTNKYTNMITALTEPLITTTSKISTRYLSEMFKLKCMPDLLNLKVFPNSKEFTESAAAYNAVRTHLKHLKKDDPTIAMVAIGDGCTPRTATLFAFLTKWHCYSIDPRMRVPFEWNTRIQRLTASPNKIEDIQETLRQLLNTFSSVVFVAVHSHADLSIVEKINHPNKSVVAIPCCVKQELQTKPDVEYADFGILSPERTVLVWRKVQ